MFIKGIKEIYPHQFVSEILNYWQQYSTRCVLQYNIINYVTMATYWVTDLPDVKGLSGTLWHSVSIFLSDASIARSRKHINVLGRPLGLV